VGRPRRIEVDPRVLGQAPPQRTSTPFTCSPSRHTGGGKTSSTLHAPLHESPFGWFTGSLHFTHLGNDTGRAVGHGGSCVEAATTRRDDCGGGGSRSPPPPVGSHSHSTRPRNRGGLAYGTQDVRGCKPEHKSEREERQEEEDTIDLHRVRSFPLAGNPLGGDVLHGEVRVAHGYRQQDGVC
jgi:hypothetical protein